MTSALFWIPFAIGAVLIAAFFAVIFIGGFMDMVVSKMGGGR